jgi:hypothetical protein
LRRPPWIWNTLKTFPCDPPTSFALHVERGHELRERGVEARRRNLRHRLAVDGLLGARAGDVHDRRLAAHRDRFLHAATRRSPFTVAMKLPVSSMPSRLTVLNPAA